MLVLIKYPKELFLDFLSAIPESGKPSEPEEVLSCVRSVRQRLPYYLT